LAHIKVVALTANAMKETKETMLQAGFDGYLPKPFHHREFMGMVNSMLENLVSSRGAA
jgi:CheY-like chemotaxis protein